MNGLCITDAVKQFAVTSKTLRYYERVGLLQAKRADSNNYRYYNEAEVERIKQIVILRKMQISIKDIIRIYENEDMSTVVEVFVNRINSIDEEVGALIELKRITNDFLQTMIQNGITKISAIPLLYEEMDKQLNELDERRPAAIEKTHFSEGDLSAVSEKLAKPLNINIVDLPPMRVLTSFKRPDTISSDYTGFLRYLQVNGLSQATSGNHRQFEFQTEAGDVLMVRVSEDFVNDSEYTDYTFTGGLFASVIIYLDEDLGQCFRTLVRELDANPYYQFAYCPDGTSRHPALLENLISPDDKRELVSLLVPVKKRLADSALFDKPEEAPDISAREIEAANPVLWTVDVPFDTLKPINNPHYRILDSGELEYTGWISTRVLSTEVEVKLPFRVDIEFRVGDDKLYGYGSTEESVIFYHGEHGQNENYGFGINMDNNPDANLSAEAIIFYQPVFRDRFKFPKRGRINNGVYNKLSWIIGEKHLAVIINNEVRYCGIGFPYMALDLSRESKKPIMIGSDGQGIKYFKSIRVSQLAETAKPKLKTGELIMITKQSNNIIPVIHRLVTNEYGENYWFNGCAKYVMECQTGADGSRGEKDYDYWFFAGVTGDIFTQHYAYDKYAGDALTSYMMDESIGGNPVKYVEDIFAKCGYAATYVSNQDLQKNTEMYQNTLISYIDKGIPVIAWGTPLVGVFVGYEDYGKVLLYITDNKDQPERVSLDKIIRGEVEKSQYEYRSQFGGWIFVGGKKETHPLADIYREAIYEIPRHMSVKTDAYCFGAEAFRAWANDIENGKFDGMRPDEFDGWAHYTNYVCVLATNGGCCHGFLKKAQELNPDMVFLEEVSRLYESTQGMWNDLEALGGGFNVTLEALQDKGRRDKIVAKIREFAKVTDEVMRILTENAKPR